MEAYLFLFFLRTRFLKYSVIFAVKIFIKKKWWRETKVYRDFDEVRGMIIAIWDG
jgi:hypothetical protein